MSIHHDARIASPSRRVTVLIVLCAIAVPGCDPQSNTTGPNTKIANSATMEQANMDFRVALSFLDNFHEYESVAATERILYHLQKWIDVQHPDPDWIADPLFNQLPKRFDRMQGRTVLSRLQFSKFDIMVLREAMWARDLAEQVRGRPLGDVRLAEWLLEQVGNLGESALGDLETATGICDWVVRNIQMEPIRTGEGLPAAGAWYLPGESLLLGRGDWLVRSRIAILMARQVGIPMVLLGFEQEEGEPQPWCLAALISNQLYLFEMRMGMPIASKDARGIARLEELVDHPELLAQMNDPNGETYFVDQQQLKKVVALIDATPEFLSQRMKLMEVSLPDDRQLILTTAPSPLRQELRKCKGIGTNVSLWTVPYDTYLFRQDALRTKIFPENVARIQSQLAILDGQTSSPLAMARRQHFRGNYSNTDFENGAKAYYLSCRIPDAELEKMKDIKQLAKVVGGLRKLPEDEAVRRRILEAAKKTIRTAKENASYWLGLIAFDEGNYKVAENYFLKRTLLASPQGPWTAGASYNLGRTYEQMGLLNDDDALLAKARLYYSKEMDSPQAPGNRIRAARLEGSGD